MATSSNATVLFRMPATYPYNQNRGVATANFNTDTETNPSTSTPSSYVFEPPVAYSAEKRNVQVQTGVFHTDGLGGQNPFLFQQDYILVPKSAL